MEARIMLIILKYLTCQAMYHLEKYDSMGEGGGGEKNEIVI
jgi:hypothetical protein